MKKIALIFILLVTQVFPLASSNKPIRLNSNIKKMKNGQILFRFNQKGDLVEQFPLGLRRVTYGSYGTLSSYYVNEFDENNNVINRTTYTHDDLVTEKAFYKTKSDGSILEVFNDGFKESYTYDKLNRVEKIVNNNYTIYFDYNEDETKNYYRVNEDTYFFIYDENKKVLREELRYNNEVIFIIKYIYDDEGFISELHGFNLYDGIEELAFKLVFEYE